MSGYPLSVLNGMAGARADVQQTTEERTRRADRIDAGADRIRDDYY